MTGCTSGGYDQLDISQGDRARIATCSLQTPTYLRQIIVNNSANRRWYPKHRPDKHASGRALVLPFDRSIRVILLSLLIRRPAKSPGISGSLQKSGVISRSPGTVKKTPGIEGIRVIRIFSARNRDFCRSCPKCVPLLTNIAATTPEKFCYYPPPPNLVGLWRSQKRQEIQRPQLGSSVSV